MGEQLKSIFVLVLPVFALVVLMGGYAYFFGAKKSAADIEAQKAQEGEFVNKFEKAQPFKLKLKGGKR